MTPLHAHLSRVELAEHFSEVYPEMDRYDDDVEEALADATLMDFPPHIRTYLRDEWFPTTKDYGVIVDDLIEGDTQ